MKGKDDHHLLVKHGRPETASVPLPSSRQVPDLAEEARCQGSARSEAEGRGGRRP
jgi:hypothetical protein